MTEAAGYLVRFKGDDGLHYLRVVGWNNEKVFASEGHENATDVDELAETYFPGWELRTED